MTDDVLRERIRAAIGDQYEIEEEIGRGGMSVVYRARDRRLDRVVALKVLPPELAYDPAIRTRFTREAQTAARLSHAHVVPIHDVGERDGIAYLVMAHVDGGSLATLVAREPRQPVDEVRRILAEVADALAHAHLHGVIHRDIKPDNVLLDRQSGRVMVTDFGIARAIEGGTRLTVTGVAVGTPHYMSPEQATAEREIDGRSDLYSLGVVGYQMLTGRLPFTAGTSMALLLKHLGERPQPIAELRADAPRALREAVERAMMKSPEDRWPTAAAMRDALLADATPAAPWRAGRREPVVYVSPRRGSAAASARVATPSTAAAVPGPRLGPDGVVVEPPHLAALVPEQRADLRLWHGRVGLLERVKAMRGYAWLTLGAWFASFGGVAAAVDAGVVPLLLAPLVPVYMTRKLLRRARSLRESGLRVRRVLLMPRARSVLPAPAAGPTRHQLEKLAPRELLEGPFGAAIRRAAADRAAILDVVASLPKSDRALLPEVEPTADALVERVARLAQAILRLEQSIDPRQLEELETRLAELEREGATDTPEGERRLALLRRQRATLDELRQRRATLARQLDDAGLALGSLRLDLVKLRASGLASALSDVSSATQQARALTRDIGAALEAAAEVREL